MCESHLPLFDDEAEILSQAQVGCRIVWLFGQHCRGFLSGYRLLLAVGQALAAIDHNLDPGRVWRLFRRRQRNRLKPLRHLEAGIGFQFIHRSQGRFRQQLLLRRRERQFRQILSRAAASVSCASTRYAVARLRMARSTSTRSAASVASRWASCSMTYFEAGPSAVASACWRIVLAKAAFSACGLAGAISALKTLLRSCWAANRAAASGIGSLGSCRDGRFDRARGNIEQPHGAKAGSIVGRGHAMRAATENLLVVIGSAANHSEPCRNLHPWGRLASILRTVSRPTDPGTTPRRFRACRTDRKGLAVWMPRQSSAPGWSFGTRRSYRVRRSHCRTKMGWLFRLGNCIPTRLRSAADRSPAPVRRASCNTPPRRST